MFTLVKIRADCTAACHRACAYIFIEEISSSFAPEAISDPCHQLGHLLSILLLQPLLMQLGSPALIPCPVLSLPYQTLLQCQSWLMDKHPETFHTYNGDDNWC